MIAQHLDVVALREAAGAVLDGNWLGGATKPAPELYPHQWSWDSAFIAIGNAGRNAGRATSELEALFGAQWSTGMVPHIVFDTDAVGYFPPAAWWASRETPAAPPHVATSGICQPPVHAMATRRVAERLPAGRASRFLRAMYEPLVAWHDYLHRERTTGDELVEIWHPWESGMDNSPAWDGPMAALRPSIDELPDYRRVDTHLAAIADRPTDLDYDRYLFLAAWLRRHHYLPDDPTTVPFRVCDVLFNALLVHADRDLAWIAERLGADGATYEARSDALCAAIDDELWHDELGCYASLDAATATPITTPVAGSLGALLAISDPARIERVVTHLVTRFAVPIGSDDGLMVPTVPLDHPCFEPTRYWRGPSWVNICWLVAEGLDRVGENELAGRLRTGICELVAASGFFEYYDPTTVEGRGSSSFSWTAALTIDALNH